MNAARRPFNNITLCTGVGGLEFRLSIAGPRVRIVCYIGHEAGTAATVAAPMEDAPPDMPPVRDNVATVDAYSPPGQQTRDGPRPIGEVADRIVRGLAKRMKGRDE